MARIYYNQANWEVALTHLNEAEKLSRALDNKRGLAQCEHILGAITFHKGDLKNAKAIFMKGLSYLNLEKDSLLVANIEISLGNIFASERNHDEALNYYQSCLRKFQELNDNRRAAEVRNNLGMVYNHKKDYEYALFEYDECIKLSTEGRYLPILGMAYVNKAMVYIGINELRLAAFYASKGMDVCYQVNNTLAIADIYKLKGIIAKKQFEFQLAEEYLKASLRLNDELRNEQNFAEAAFELGLVYHELNIKNSYEFYFNKALEYYLKINAEEKVSEIKEFLK